jgi:hypothetical protein
LIEIGLLVVEKKIFKDFFTPLLLSPLGQGYSSSFEQFLTHPPHNDDLYQV